MQYNSVDYIAFFMWLIWQHMLTKDKCWFQDQVDYYCYLTIIIFLLFRFLLFSQMFSSLCVVIVLFFIMIFWKSIFCSFLVNMDTNINNGHSLFFSFYQCHRLFLLLFYSQIFWICHSALNLLSRFQVFLFLFFNIQKCSRKR